MALRIATPAILKKIEALARAIGLNETDTVEKDVDRLLVQRAPAEPERVWKRFQDLLAQLDRIPDLPSGCDPLAWDEHGLPR